MKLIKLNTKSKKIKIILINIFLTMILIINLQYCDDSNKSLAKKILSNNKIQELAQSKTQPKKEIMKQTSNPQSNTLNQDKKEDNTQSSKLSKNEVVINELSQIKDDKKSTTQNNNPQSSKPSKNEVVINELSQIKDDTNKCDKQCKNALNNIVTKNDINATDNSKNTALHIFARSKNSSNIDIAEKILKHIEVKPNEKNNNNHTPLHLAVQTNNEKMVTLLLTNGKTEVNIKNRYQQTPLHIATSMENPNKNIILMLTKHKKIDFSIKNVDGAIVLDELVNHKKELGNEIINCIEKINIHNIKDTEDKIKKIQEKNNEIKQCLSS